MAHSLARPEAKSLGPMLGSFGDDYAFDDEPPDWATPLSPPALALGVRLDLPEPAPEADADESFTVVISATGPLGLKLARSAGTCEMVVEAINLAGAAAAAERGSQLKEGLALRQVNEAEVSTANSTKQVLGWIREASRPLTLVFSPRAVELPSLGTLRAAETSSPVRPGGSLLIVRNDPACLSVKAGALVFAGGAAAWAGGCVCAVF